MAEAGSFADRVKQQADIVRVIGEYVRLKKSGQNFTGLCPFHSEKTPSFAVHPVKQIYHCFGCGAGGDVFKFVMEMDKCDFPEAVRTVADKCGIAIPQPRETFAGGTARAAAAHRAGGDASRGCGIFRAATRRHAGGQSRAGLSGGSRAGRRGHRAVRLGLRAFRRRRAVAASEGQISGKLLEVSGLVGRDPSGRLYDRFRRRIMFPIANEAGKVIAFGGRALGDDLPKYLNSPETPIYTKSTVLYHLDRAKEAIRQGDAVVLVEGYMDAIAVARAGIGNVVASCGTSLTETQVKLLSRFTRRVIVNYDPDTAGQAATERSLPFCWSRIATCAFWRCPAGRTPTASSRRRRGGLSQAAGSRAALSRLSDRPRAAVGHGHGGREVARGEFPDALRAANSQRAAAFGMGLAHLAAVARGRAGAARRRCAAPPRSAAAK